MGRVLNHVPQGKDLPGGGADGPDRPRREFKVGSKTEKARLSGGTGNKEGRVVTDRSYTPAHFWTIVVLDP